MPVTFLSLAVWDLAAARATIAADDPVAAQRVGRRLSQIMARLATMPNLGKPRQVFDTRELVTPKIGKMADVVVYRVRGEQVQILRVLSGMRDLEQILQGDFPEEGN
jgi:toxin ParE1/3/4